MHFPVRSRFPKYVDALQVQVEELEDPVEDKHGYIYERSAIVDMITRQRGGAVKCPIMGTSHFVSVGELKAAKRKPSKRANNQQRADIDEEIIDA